MRRSTPSSIPSIALVLAALAFGAWGLWLPHARSLDAPDDTFSAERALEIVRSLARAPHPLGSPENTRVRREIVRRLQDLGFETRVQSAPVVYDHPLREESRVRVAWAHNVVARREGSTDAPALALMSHYDSVPSGPGAGDDGSGVATLLEVARALGSREEPLRRDLILVITDGEEIGLMGAQSFLREDPWANEIGLLMNFEARGAAGPPFMFQTGPGNAALVAEFAKAAPRPNASSMSIEVYRRMPNDTDATIVEASEIPYLNTAFVDDYFRYHAGSDTPENLSLRTLQHEGDNALALVRHFGVAESLPGTSGDATYFNLSPRFLLRYPESVTMATGIAALLVGLWALTVGWRHERYRLPGLLTGIGWSVAGWLGAFWLVDGVHEILADTARPYALFYRYHLLVVAYAASTLGFLAALWNEREGLRRLAAAAGALAILVMVALVPSVGWPALAAVVLLVLAAARPAWYRADAVAAVHVAIFLALLGLTLWAAPHASYLFTWPLLLGGAVLGRVWARNPESRTGYALGYLTVPVLWTTVLYSVYLALGVERPGMVMLVLAVLLGFGAAWLARATDARFALGLVLASAALLVWVAETDPYDAALPRPAELFYAMDTDAGEAFWASRDQTTIPWTRKRLGPEPGEIEAQRFFPEQEGTWRANPTATLEIARPILEAAAQASADGWTRTIRVSVPRDLERLQLVLPPATYTSGTVAGLPAPLPETAEDSYHWDLWGVPADGAEILVSGTGEPPGEARWTAIDYSAPAVVRAVPAPPADVMPTPWGLSEAAVLTGTVGLTTGSEPQETAAGGPDEAKPDD